MPGSSPNAINLVSGYPYADAVPVEALVAAARALAQDEGDRPFQYLGSARQSFLREWLARAMGPELGAEDQLLVTFGALQGLDLAAQAALDRDTAVLVQSPTYMEALEVFRNYTDHIVPVAECDGVFPMGAVEEALEGAARRGTPVRLIYWGADFQNPTGLVTPESDRRELVSLAARHGAWLVEDAAYRDLFFGEPLPSLKALDSAQHVVYLGTLSKTVAPGLRIGWAVGPKRLLTAMDRMKKDLGNPFVEAVVGEYLQAIDYESHVRELRQAYAQRAEEAVKALGAPAQGVEVPKPRGGYFLWVRLRETWDSDHVAAFLAQEGIMALSGRWFCVETEPDPHAIRLSFSYQPLDQLIDGFSAAGRALRAFAEAHP